MTAIALIGAGSVTFTRSLLIDMLGYPELREAEFRLHDVDPRRLAVAERLSRELGASVVATLDRREALAGCDAVLFMVQVGGHRSTVLDFELPRRRGIEATIGDTLGIGGVFRALRTFPVIDATAREMAELCPDAWLLNYTNPMAMLCWAVYEGTPLERVVGLCHSVQHTAAKLGRLLGEEELDFEVAGVNHLAFFLRLATHDGEDLYPKLAAAVEADPDGIGRTVRAELLRRLGYFVTESSEHAAEYVPWFLGRPELVERFRIPIGEYVRRSEANLAEFEAVAAGGEPRPAEPGEYAPAILHALATGEPFRFNGNVRNDGWIANLPAGACVEVPCVADGDGIHPQRFGELPPQLAAVDRAYLSVCELAVRAWLERRREHVYHACALDPAAAAQASLEAIRVVCDELFAAHGDAIPPALRP